MDRAELRQLRIMLLSGKTYGAQTLRAVLGIAGMTRVVQVDTTRRAIELLSTDHFDVVFSDEASEAYDGLSFPMAVRRTASVCNPMLPVFVFHERAYRRTVEKARDTGATDFITCPISPKTVTTKLLAAMANPRAFIKAPAFFGPDRRGKARATYDGPDRRSRTPRKIRVQKTTNIPPDPVQI